MKLDFFYNVFTDFHSSSYWFVTLGYYTNYFKSFVVIECFQKRNPYGRWRKKYYAIVVRIICFFSTCCTVEYSICCVKNSRSKSISFEYIDAIFAAVRFMCTHSSFEPKWGKSFVRRKGKLVEFYESNRWFR